MNARQKQIIQLALDQARKLRAHYGSPQVINLSVYATDEDLRQLRPEDGPDATASQQREIVDAVAAALRADGNPVRLITLRVVDYLKWLTENAKDNNAANRAAWLSYQQK